MHWAWPGLRFEILRMQQCEIVGVVSRRLVQQEMALISRVQFGNTVPHPVVACREPHHDFRFRVALMLLLDPHGGFAPVGVVFALPAFSWLVARDTDTFDGSGYYHFGGIEMVLHFPVFQV